MKVFVSFDGDHIGRMIGRASLSDNPEEVSKIAQAIDRGNAVWRSWAESHGGKVINIGGDEGRLEVEADHLQELPKIRDQYASAVGSTVSVGVGTKLSEADKSLMAAKMQGGDRIQLYTEEVNELLEELQEKEEGAKLYDEYLDPDAGLKKAQPGMNQGSNAGFSGASRPHAAAPTAPTEGSEHSEAEVLRQELANAPPQPQPVGQPGATDYEQLFHQAAGQTPDEEQQKPSGLDDGVRAQVVKILQDVRAHAPEIAQMKQSNPDLYNSVKGLVDAMIALAQSKDQEGQPQPVQKSEGKPCKHFFGRGTKCLKCKKEKMELEKASLEAGKTGRHQVVLPVGSQVDSGPSADHEAGKLKIRDPESQKTKWRSVRAGVVMAPDGTPTSSRNPSGS